MNKTAVVTTTIYTPEFLKRYEQNAEYYGHDVDFIVIGDMKTPKEAKEFCAGIKNCRYMDVEEQERWLTDRKALDLREHLPYNSIARRNVGHLVAYAEKYDSIIMLDDDNLATGQDFIKGHELQPGNMPIAASLTGWFNVCSVLEEQHGVEFYARGFPPAERWKDTSTTWEKSLVYPVVNAGLWLNDPDIDAITRLERRLISTGFKNGSPQKFALYNGTWTPWNCQNTAMNRMVIPSYFLSPHVGRHLDIWASYITTRIVDHIGHSITVGTPLAYHDRSPHNLYKDLQDEVQWISQTDLFCRALRMIEGKGVSYHEALINLTEDLRHALRLFPVINKYVEGLRAWSDACTLLGA